MSLWKRAVLYLTRKRGRSISLVMFLFLMSCFVIVGYSLKKSAEQETDRLRQSFASGFVLEVDVDNPTYWEKVEAKDGSTYNAYTGPVIKEEMIEQVLAIDGVKNYLYDDLVDLVWADLKLKPGAWADRKPDAKRIPGAFTMMEDELMVMRNETKIWPCRNGETNKNFRTGALTLSKGRNIQADDHFKAVISEWLAEENGLSVGDSFHVEIKEGMVNLYSEEQMKTVGEPIKLEVVGVFRPNFSQKVSEYTYEDSFIENMIYTDMDTHSRLAEISNLDTDIYGKIEFLVDDPEKVDSIMQQIKGMDTIDLENMELTVDSTAYEAAEKPYRQIRIFSTILLVVGIAGMGMILYLLLKLWAQGRKREVGILLSIGIRKGKVFVQMLTECFLIAVAALLLSFLLSGPLLDKCADAAERITAPRADVEAYEVTLDVNSSPVVTKTSSDEVVLEHRTSVESMAFAAFFVCGISCISVCLSFTQLSSQEPKKLLRSM